MFARLACLLLLVAATPVVAQDPGAPISIPGGGPPDAPPLPGPPPLQVFISPAGEPFHAKPGEAYPVGAWFARADANHDGALSAEELLADSLAFFDRLDTDRDHIIDGFEVADYERDIAPEITGLLPRRDRPDGDRPQIATPPTRAEQMWGAPTLLHPRGKPIARPRRQGAAQYGLLNEPHPVRGADADLDQRVSRAEAAAAARRRFDLLDIDHDGRLALSELPVTPAQAIGEAAPEGPRRKAPPKRIEMPLQPTAANPIEVAAPAVLSSHETP